MTPEADALAERILDTPPAIDDAETMFDRELNMVAAQAEHDDEIAETDPDAKRWVDNDPSEIAIDETRGALLRIIGKAAKRRRWKAIRDAGEYLRALRNHPDVKRALSLLEEPQAAEAVHAALRDVVHSTSRSAMQVLELNDESLAPLFTEREREIFTPPPPLPDGTPDYDHPWYCEDTYRDGILHHMVRQVIVSRLQLTLRGYDEGRPPVTATS